MSEETDLLKKAIRWFIYASNDVNNKAADRAFELIGKLAASKRADDNFDLDYGETIIELEERAERLK